MIILFAAVLGFHFYFVKGYAIVFLRELLEVVRFFLYSFCKSNIWYVTTEWLN